MLLADKDAHVAEDAPDANAGTGPTLKVESKVLLVAANKRLLCSFDLRGLPATAVRLLAATLRLTPLAATAGRALRCHQVVGPWTEPGVTWNTQPGVGTDHGTAASGPGPQAWDVSTSARAAFPQGRVDFRVKDDAEGSLLGKVQVYPSRERPGEATQLVVLFEEQRATTLTTTLRARARRKAFLDSTMVVAAGRDADLASRLLPKLHRRASLLSQVQARLARARGLASFVWVFTTRAAEPPSNPDLLPGRNPTPADDFLRLSEQAGSTIAHASKGRWRTLRRLVHVVDTREVQSFPRAATSERGRPTGQDQLRRGDAVLYAAGGDAFRPGDSVTWQARTWVVVGLLDAEMVGDVKVYQEVGLRRLSVTACGRLEGRIETSG